MTEPANLPAMTLVLIFIRNHSKNGGYSAAGFARHGDKKCRSGVFSDSGQIQWRGPEKYADRSVGTRRAGVWRWCAQ